MATSSRSNPSPASRKIIRLGVAVTAAILLYTGGWYWAATALDKRLQHVFETRDPGETTLDCADRQFRGYPFRIGLYCSGITIDDHLNGISASLGDFRSAAQIYAPGHIIWELDGPAQIRSTSGIALSLQWQSLHSSVVTNFRGIERSSIEATDLQVALTNAFGELRLDIATPHAESHVRRNEGDLDYAALVRDMTISSQDGGVSLPTLSASIDATLAGQAARIEFGDGGPRNLHGVSGELHRLVIDLGEGRILTLNGPLAVGATGLLSGKLHVEIENLGGWSEELKTRLPQSAEAIDSATSILTVLFGGKGKGGADLRIDDGLIQLGIIPLGRIPPI